MKSSFERYNLLVLLSAVHHHHMYTGKICGFLLLVEDWSQ